MSLPTQDRILQSQEAQRGLPVVDAVSGVRIEVDARTTGVESGEQLASIRAEIDGFDDSSYVSAGIDQLEAHANDRRGSETLRPVVDHVTAATMMSRGIGHLRGTLLNAVNNVD